MSAAGLDLASEFDLRGTTYLDGANHGPMSRASIAAALDALDWKRDPSALDDAQYFALPDRIRVAAAELLGCRPVDVAIATGASHGISLVACGLDWQPDDHVVVPRGEFPANNLPWLALRDRGIDVEFVDADVADAVLDAIRADTRVVAVGHVNFANGRRLDIDRIGAACSAVGALFLVDAAQSLGTVPFDVDACGAAVVAVAGYKWLMSPYGTGLTYVHPDWIERLALPVFNWSTIEGADDFNRLAGLAPRHRPGAARFDVPETAAFVHGRAMAESLELLTGVGVERIYAHATALLDRVIAGLPETFRVDSPLDPAQRSSILRLVGPSPDATARTHRRLRERGIAVSLREGGLRVAPGIWNTPADVDKLTDVLSSG